MRAAPPTARLLRRLSIKQKLSEATHLSRAMTKGRKNLLRNPHKTSTSRQMPKLFPYNAHILPPPACRSQDPCHMPTKHALPRVTLL